MKRDNDARFIAILVFVAALPVVGFPLAAVIWTARRLGFWT